LEKQHNIALIFFSRTKADEARQKSWFKEKSKNQELARLLIERAVSAIKSSGIPVYHFNEENQKGRSFGERIANAYQEIFDLGYEQVISVGNDCPNLQNINWQEISLNLKAGKSVLGPDKRGGAYLIGIQKASFEKKKFENLSWQKRTLYSELKQFCKNHTCIIELQKSRDINSFHDIRILSNSKNTIDKFYKILFQFLIVINHPKEEFPSSNRNFYIFTDSPLRAPPLLLAS
jgi:2-phospho-L-lactate guanylyltransferase (CobY/MobA/RfbA family)